MIAGWYRLLYQRVEAEPLANIRDVDAKRFVWKTLSLSLGSPMPSSQTMVFNLIAKPSGDTVVT